MKRMTLNRGGLVWVALLAGGCGAMPDLLVETMKSSAKEALQGAVEDVVDEVIDDAVGQLLDYADLEAALVDETGDAEDGDTLEESSDDTGGNDQDASRSDGTAVDDDAQG